MGGPQLTFEEFVAQGRAFLESLTAARHAYHEVRDDLEREADRFALFSGSSPAEVEAAVAFQRSLYDAGYGWISGPVEDGGGGYPVAFETAFVRLQRAFDVPSKAPLSVSLGMVAPTIAQFGSPATKKRWLRALYRADAIGCQLFSEPGAGSDLAAVQTRAVRDGDDWILNGQKVWTSGAHYSDVGIVMTRTASGPRHRNITVFALDMHAPGVQVRPLRQMTGGADFNEVFLTDVRVADADRLGDVDAGWKVAMAMLMHERGAIGGSSSGGSGIFRMDDLAEWLRAIGRADDPAVAQAFARVYCGVTAAKAMRARADANFKSNGLPGPEMSLGKLALTSNLSALSDLVRLALGPRIAADTGEERTFAWSELVLGVPGMRIGGGTDEIHRNTIAERVLGLPKESAARPAEAVNDGAGKES